MTVFRGERALVVIVMIADLSVLALESVRPRDAVSAFDALPQVLGDHAHKLVGKFSSLSKAIAASEHFVVDWKRGLSLEACSCIERGQL